MARHGSSALPIFVLSIAAVWVAAVPVQAGTNVLRRDLYGPVTGDFLGGYIEDHDAVDPSDSVDVAGRRRPFNTHSPRGFLFPSGATYDLVDVDADADADADGSLTGSRWSGSVPTVDEVRRSRSPLERFAKRNIDEIDRTAFDNFFKRNLDEIDRVGWSGFVKRLDNYLNSRISSVLRSD